MLKPRTFGRRPQPHSQARDDGPGKHQPHDSHMRSFFFSLFQMFIIDFIFQGTDRQTTRGRADNGRGIVYFSLNSRRQRIETSLPRLWLTSRRNLSRQSRRSDKFCRNPRPRPGPGYWRRASVCVYAGNAIHFFFFPQPRPDCVQDNNTYVPHTAVNTLWPSERAHACARV